MCTENLWNYTALIYTWQLILLEWCTSIIPIEHTHLIAHFICPLHGNLLVSIILPFNSYQQCKSFSSVSFVLSVVQILMYNILRVTTHSKFRTQIIYVITKETKIKYITKFTYDLVVATHTSAHTYSSVHVIYGARHCFTWTCWWTHTQMYARTHRPHCKKCRAIATISASVVFFVCGS